MIHDLDWKRDIDALCVHADQLLRKLGDQLLGKLDDQLLRKLDDQCYATDNGAILPSREPDAVAGYRR